MEDTTGRTHRPPGGAPHRLQAEWLESRLSSGRETLLSCGGTMHVPVPVVGMVRGKVVSSKPCDLTAFVNCT